MGRSFQASFRRTFPCGHGRGSSKARIAIRDSSESRICERGIFKAPTGGLGISDGLECKISRARTKSRSVG
ncbi:unnamed protein product [Linum trigynum]|uniref:Uncharacterized protein n=1 Tax=Linum trigynum TaxID=586398 RepID=A0AAV2EU73_9ROSI